MKKLLLLALSLVLSLICCAGLAEPAEIALPEPQDLAVLFPDDEIVTKDFGDFTISYPSSMTILAEREGNEQLKTLFEIYDQYEEGYYRTLTISWLDMPVTFSDAYLSSITEYEMEALEAMKEDLAGYGFPMQYAFDSSNTTDLGGHQAAYIIYHTSADYLWMQTDESYYDLYVPLGEKGTYSFTISTNSLADSVVLSSILNTVKWKE